MTQSSATLRIDLCPTDAHGTGWLAALQPGQADIGRLRVGPAGLARRLGVWLGTAVEAAPQAERVVVVDRILHALDDGAQWFSRTRTTDRVGAAQWMLHAHDALRTAGWSGQPLQGSPRLLALSKLRHAGVGPDLLPGLPDVLHDIANTLGARQLPMPMHLSLEAPLAHYSAVVQRVLSALQVSGVRVDEPPAPTPQAPADTDLGRLQRALLGGNGEPLLGDGTVRLLQGESPWEAAALATALCPDDGAWLVTAEGALLDKVRGRFDRPTLGLSEPSRWRPALQILPLALALQTSPQDPQAALELLTLSQSPVPGRIRGKLLYALSNQPAVASPMWVQELGPAIDAHCKKYESDPAKLRARMATLFPSKPGTTVRVDTAIKVCNTVSTWARAVGSKPNTTTVADTDVALLAAAGVATSLASSLKLLPPDLQLDRLQLLHYHDMAVGNGVAMAAEAQAGAPPVVGAPEAVPRGVSRLTWFGAIAGAGELGRAIPWSPVERDAMLSAGLTLPAEGVTRQLEQAGWVHAVLAATGQLDVVSWQTSGADAAESHPMLDQWAARLPSGALHAIQLRAQDVLAEPGRPDTRAIALAPAILPRGVWQLPAGLVSTQRAWSASSIESLITCPLGWVFNYSAGLRPGRADSLPDLRALAGSFAHALFEEVLFEPTPGWVELTPEHASARVVQRFDERVHTEAAPLVLPQTEAFAHRLRDNLGRAAAQLVTQLKAGGWRPKAAEQDVAELSGRFGGTPLRGSIDLLLVHHTGKHGVIDLKLGGSRYRAGTLEGGTALQLAVYAKAAANGPGPLPPVGYFILEDGELLTTDGAAFPKAHALDGPTAEQVFLDTQRAWAWWASTLNAGHVVGRGEHLAPELAVDLDHEALAHAAGSEAPDHPWVDKHPTCRFCNAQRLCSFSRPGANA